MVKHIGKEFNFYENKSIKIKFHEIIIKMKNLINEADFLASKILEIDGELGINRKMPSLMCQKILIVAEDKRAWKHVGFDILAIFRSLFLTSIGKPHGGSTILQQLIRTLSGRYEKSVNRKIREIVLSYLVAKRVPRHIYPRVYLSIAYYGTDMENYDKLIERKQKILKDDLHMAISIVARLKYPEPKKISIVKRNLILKREKFLLKKFQSVKDKRIFSHVQAF